MIEIIKHIYYSILVIILLIFIGGPIVIVSLDKKLKPWIKYAIIITIILYILCRVFII